MNKKVQEAYNIIKHYEEKQREKETKWHMYEPAGCGKCSKGQICYEGDRETSVTYYNRCECANRETKEYKKFLKDKNNMLVKDFEEISNKFYDNNNHIKVGSTMADRSW